MPVLVWYGSVPPEGNPHEYMQTPQKAPLDMNPWPSCFESTELTSSHGGSHAKVLSYALNSTIFSLKTKWVMAFSPINVSWWISPKHNHELAALILWICSTRFYQCFEVQYGRDSNIINNSQAVTEVFWSTCVPQMYLKWNVPLQAQQV